MTTVHYTTPSTKKTVTPPVSKFHIDEVQVASITANARETRRLYRECRRPSKEQRYLDRLMLCRASLQAAFGGNNDRFRSEWADVMEGRS